MVEVRKNESQISMELSKFYEILSFWNLDFIFLSKVLWVCMSLDTLAYILEYIGIYICLILNCSRIGNFIQVTHTHFQV